MKVCVDCGSSHIEVMVWINPNTEEVTDWETGIREAVYCNDCGSHNKSYLDRDWETHTFITHLLQQ